MIATEQLSDTGPGWCLVRSAVLGETVLWLRDDQTAFPRSAAGHVVYTLDELDRLVDSGTDAETLRSVHRLKRSFPGAAFLSVRSAPEGEVGEAWSVAAGAPPLAVAPPAMARPPVLAPAAAAMEFEW